MITRYIIETTLKDSEIVYYYTGKDAVISGKTSPILSEQPDMANLYLTISDAVKNSRRIANLVYNMTTVTIVDYLFNSIKYKATYSNGKLESELYFNG